LPPGEDEEVSVRILAIDPGESSGVARLDVVDVSKLGVVRKEIVPVFVRTFDQAGVYAELEGPQFYDAVVLEEFRLFPWMATYQSFSELPTVEVIGVVKYLCAKNDTPLYVQRADIKKEARSIAEATGWKMKDRSLGSGKGKYRGPDFDYPGPQHPRDALAHGIYWIYRHRMSPLKNADAEVTS